MRLKGFVETGGAEVDWEVRTCTPRRSPAPTAACCRRPARAPLRGRWRCSGRQIPSRPRAVSSQSRQYKDVSFCLNVFTVGKYV